MVASLVSMPEFLRSRTARTPNGPWTNQELAELSRVVNLLARAGLTVETDSGMTDEGDPWFVFANPNTGDVIAHLARIDGRFVAAGANAGVVLDGRDFRDVVDKIMASQPLAFGQPQAPSERPSSRAYRRDEAAPTGMGLGERLTPRDTNAESGSGSNVTTLFTHPSIVLAAFVATALMHGRKSGDSGTSSSTTGPTTKGALDARSSAPNARAQLTDTLTSLAVSESAAGGNAGTGGFMLHSTGMASAVAIVVAAATPISSGADGSGTTMLATLSHALTGNGSGDESANQTGSADDSHAQGRDDPTHSPRPFDSLSAGPRADGGEAASVQTARSVGDGPAAHHGHPDGDPGAPDTLVDADLFLVALKAESRDRNAEPSAPHPTGDGSSSDAASADGAHDGDAGSGTSTQGNAGRATTVASAATTAPSDGSGAGDDGGGGSTAVANAGNTAGSEAFSITVWIESPTDSENQLALNDATSETDGGGTHDTPACEFGAGPLDTIEPTDALLLIYQSAARPTHGAPIGDTPDVGGAGGQDIVYAGGLLQVDTFDPIHDTLSITGEPATQAFYQVIATYDGVEFRFDADNIVTLTGVGLEDLGFA
ncbi:hypothetical protein F1188_05460 [Roseospira marina]|uniref:Uncharacterized protein n=1 Tax=Roseospira marina TaxID=140057 RepID=A0A5M6IFW5_9PROT|nr:hypothetical protein [Roseospira marina]KAA5606777.1 hypothetical protein F1188_05460 [Roseospira marina]MBB4313801.1 hypothetical protein [Roseospira marina]MBB5086963.1 hypothetical protein [Roseospira marina]